MKSNAARDKRYELELRKKPCELEAKKHGDFIPVMVRVFKDSISRMQSFSPHSKIMTSPHSKIMTENLAWSIKPRTRSSSHKVRCLTVNRRARLLNKI